MLKLHKLFLNDQDPSSFDEVIKPTEFQRKTLTTAKNAIRDHLRAKLRAASTELLGMDKMIGPRFRTQGSWAYGTCIQFAHPGQEMDWDFGVYLPVELLADKSPKTAAKDYFDLIENALSSLCRDRGWSLDRTKNSCVRVKIANWAHIDVPLYAIPASEFHTVQERAQASKHISSEHRDSIALDESEAFDELPQSFYQLLEGIHLATRKGTWQPSDPEAVSKWFNDKVELHGPQLQRVCRYVKGWRDFQWPNDDGPSSIALMILVVRGYLPQPRRDDIAIEDAARALRDGLGGDIRDFGIEQGRDDFNRLNAEQRKAAQALAKDFHDQFSLARRYSQNLARDAITKMREQFGTRIPNDVSLVISDDSTDIVRRTPATAVLPPVVGSNESG